MPTTARVVLCCDTPVAFLLFPGYRTVNGRAISLPHQPVIITRRFLVSNAFAVQKGTGHFRPKRKVHILRNITCKLCDTHRVKLRCHNSNQVTTCIKERPAAVARLNWRANLKIARVVTKPCESAHITNRHIGG